MYGRLTTVFSITGQPIRKRHYLTPMMLCSRDKLRLRLGLLSTHLQRKYLSVCSYSGSLCYIGCNVVFELSIIARPSQVIVGSPFWCSMSFVQNGSFFCYLVSFLFNAKFCQYFNYKSPENVSPFMTTCQCQT